MPKEATGHARKRRSYASYYEATVAEMDSFRDLQSAFSSPTFLVHLDPTCRLYIDLDASKEWGFAAMVYHIAGNELSLRIDVPCTDVLVQPILFLSKRLNQAEKNYWPMELEVAWEQESFFEVFYYMEEHLDIDDIDKSSEPSKYYSQTLSCS